MVKTAYGYETDFFNQESHNDSAAMLSILSVFKSQTLQKHVYFLVSD